jgi:shikimate 5-dehydrogenase
MAWVAFKNTSRYYRKVRQGKKVHSIYLGNGAAAEAAAQAVEDASKERVVLRERKRRDQALDDQIKALMSQGSAITAQVLTAAGLHQYQRQWRRKRQTKP